MSTDDKQDDDEFPDLTVDTADLEPRYADIDNETNEEAVQHAEWLRRNIAAIGRRGLECFIDDED